MADFVEEKVGDIVYKIPLNKDRTAGDEVRIAALTFHALAKIAEKLDKLIELSVQNVITEEKSTPRNTFKDAGDPGPEKNTPTGLIRMQAKFAGKCAQCGQYLKEGYTIYYDPNNKKIYCTKCGGSG